VTALATGSLSTGPGPPRGAPAPASTTSRAGYLTEGLIEEAWSAAARFGPGHAWRELAEASGPDRALDAAALFRLPIESKLVNADTRTYPEIVRLLVEIRRLSAAGGDQDWFADYTADIRRRFEKRRALMQAMDAKHL
jgi:hypothetical protein